MTNQYVNKMFLEPDNPDESGFIVATVELAWSEGNMGAQLCVGDCNRRIWLEFGVDKQDNTIDKRLAKLDNMINGLKEFRKAMATVHKQVKKGAKKTHE